VDRAGKSGLLDPEQLLQQQQAALESQLFYEGLQNKIAERTELLNQKKAKPGGGAPTPAPNVQPFHTVAPQIVQSSFEGLRATLAANPQSVTSNVESATRFMDRNTTPDKVIADILDDGLFSGDQKLTDAFLYSFYSAAMQQTGAKTAEELQQSFNLWVQERRNMLEGQWKQQHPIISSLPGAVQFVPIPIPMGKMTAGPYAGKQAIPLPTEPPK